MSGSIVTINMDLCSSVFPHISEDFFRNQSDRGNQNAMMNDSRTATQASTLAHCPDFDFSASLFASRFASGSHPSLAIGSAPALPEDSPCALDTQRPPVMKLRSCRPWCLGDYLQRTLTLSRVHRLEAIQPIAASQIRSCTL
jgi:hypothetical protein